MIRHIVFDMGQVLVNFNIGLFTDFAASHLRNLQSELLSKSLRHFISAAIRIYHRSKLEHLLLHCKYLLIHSAVLGYLLHNKFFPVEIHHIKTGKCLVCYLRIKESRAEKL